METADAAHLTPSPNARLDRITVLTGSHRIWIALLGVFFTFDLVDLNTFAYIAPALRNEWGLSIGTVGAITSASFFGMFFGGLLGGRIADRYGRRPAIIAAGSFYSVCSLLSALAPNVAVLATTRVLTGFGLQAMTGVLLVYVSEMFPRAKRGRYQSLVLALGLVGVPIAAAASRVIIPMGPGHWRWVFVIGAAGLLGILAAVKLLPESIRWQVAHGRSGQAEPLLARLETQARAATGGELAEPVETSSHTETGRVSQLFRGRYLKRTVITSAAMVCLILAFYGFSSWIPTLLVERGYSNTESLTYSLVLAIAAVPGAMLAWPFVDRFERKNLILAIGALSAVLLFVFGIVDSTAVILVIGFVVMMLLQTLVAVLYTYLPEVFPTALRGLGSGLANSLGRLSGVAGGFIVAAVYSGLGYTAVFAYLSVVTLALGLVLGIFGERTTGRGLETLA